MGTLIRKKEYEKVNKLRVAKYIRENIAPIRNTKMQKLNMQNFAETRKKKTGVNLKLKLTTYRK